MHSEYYLEVFRIEHEERLRAAERRRLAASLRIPGPVRRWCGEALIRCGLLVRGPVATSPRMLAAVHQGGFAR